MKVYVRWLIWPNANYSNIIIIMRRVFYYRYYTHIVKRKTAVFPTYVLTSNNCIFLFLYSLFSLFSRNAFALLYFKLLFFSSHFVQLVSGFRHLLVIYTHARSHTCIHTMCNFRHEMKYSIEHQMYKWIVIKKNNIEHNIIYKKLHADLIHSVLSVCVCLCLYKWRLQEEILQKPEIPTLWRNVYFHWNMRTLFIFFACVSVCLCLSLYVSVSFSIYLQIAISHWIALFSISCVCVCCSPSSTTTHTLCNGVDFCRLCSIFLLFCFYLIRYFYFYFAVFNSACLLINNTCVCV